jgi:hypothetical protein
MLDRRVAHVWAWFNELDQARAAGMAGPAPISYPDIAAFAALKREIIAPWEVDAIRAVDAHILSEIAKASQRG